MYHWRNGWYFSRLADGNVRIAYTGSPACTHEAVIPKNEWESIEQELKKPSAKPTKR
jgi:hypothetical protein